VPVAKPPHSLIGWKEQLIDHNGAKGNIQAVLQRSPVNQFSFGDRKSHPQIGTLPLDDAEIILQSPDTRTYRVRADSHGEVVNICNCQTLGDSRVEAGYIKHKKGRRYQRALWGANCEQAENLRRALEYESALAFGEQRHDPGDQVGGETSFGEDIRQLVCADIVQTTVDIKEESRYFEGSGLE